MNILVLGFNGYVGNVLTKFLAFQENIKLYGISIDCEGDSINFIKGNLQEKSTLVQLSDIEFDLVINAAGIKDILFCENNPNIAYETNAFIMNSILHTFNRSKIIQISTDYVFDGSRGDYKEYDIPNPANVYGLSKYMAELVGKFYSQYFIIRIAALFNENSNFIKYITKNLSSKSQISCYEDSVYSPTYYKDFIDVVSKIIWHNVPSGIYHVTGEPLTRYDFAQNYAKIFQYDDNLIKGASVAEKDRIVFRPDLSLNSEETQKQLGLKFRTVKEALNDLKEGIKCSN